jgi:uncharacterized protein (TIGR03435 family)
MHRVTIAAVLLTTAAGINAQSSSITETAPKFAVASIRQSPPPTGGPMFLDFGPRPGGQWLSQNATFMMIIRSAYPEFSLPGQIVGGPSWINTERFDIDAKADGDPPREVMADMLKHLLAERFRLKVHTEPREVEVFALLLARSDGRLGPRLRKSAVDCRAVEEARKKAPLAAAAPPAPSKPPERPHCGMVGTAMNGVQRLLTGGTPVSAVATGIQQTVGRPVIDRTGLTGRYDVDLEFSGGAPLTAADQPNAPVSVFTALQEQLELKLEPRREKMDVLIIDQVERPTPN